MQYSLTSFKVTSFFTSLKLSIIDKLNKNGACLIIEILFLKDSSVKSFIFTPSINISPLVVSKYLNNKLKIVDLPLPDFPTTAIFLFGNSFKFRPVNV